MTGFIAPVFDISEGSCSLCITELKLTAFCLNDEAAICVALVELFKHVCI